MNRTLINPTTQAILRQIHHQHLVQRVDRSCRSEERVIYRPNETIHESIRTTVEVIYFRSDR
jgi:hypothetical protein